MMPPANPPQAGATDMFADNLARWRAGDDLANRVFQTGATKTLAIQQGQQSQNCPNASTPAPI